MLSSGGVSRARPGSSRCDFVGLEPSPSPLPNGCHSRRTSMAVNSVLQNLHDEWNDRPRPLLIDAEPHLLTTNSIESVKWIDLTGSGERLALTVVFPWMVVTARCGSDLSLSQFKQELFDGLRKMSVVDFSMEPSDYVFCAFTQSLGEKEDLFDEDQPIGWLMHALTTPFPLLFLHVPDGHQQEKELASLIGRAIGRPLSDMEAKLNDELKQSRVDLFNETERAHSSRGKEGFEHFAFPEEIQAVTAVDLVPRELINKISSSNLRYQLFFCTPADERAGNFSRCVPIDVDFDVMLTPHGVIGKAIQSMQLTYDDVDDVLESTNASDYLLQVVAQKKYLTGNTRQLIMYASVRTLLEDYRIPRFVVRRRAIVLEDYPTPATVYKPSYVRAFESRIGCDEISRGSNDDDNMSLWEIDDFFHLRPISCTNLGASDGGMMVYAAFAIVVGRSVIGRAKSAMTPAYNPRWIDKTVTFPNLYMKDLPSAAILCISLVEAHETKQSKKAKEKQRRRDSVRVNNWTPSMFSSLTGSSSSSSKECAAGNNSTGDGTEASTSNAHKEDEVDKDLEGYEIKPIGWCNLPVFDWRNELMQGVVHASLWPGAGPGADESNNFVSIDGDVGMNPTRTGICRLVCDTPIRKKRVVPPTEAAFQSFIEAQCKYGGIVRPAPCDPRYDVAIVDKIRELVRRHQQGHQQNDLEEKFTWHHRMSIQAHVPEALILLVDNGITWRSREHFADLYDLLNRWPVLDIGSAFCLLDEKYMDSRIREFVVGQIANQLDNSSFPLYILPLIQALKYEPRSSSALANLLLKRALHDYRIGQKLFWLLRSELSNLEDPKDRPIQYRLALLLEAYLRGNPEHLKVIVRQVEMVERLAKLSVMVKGYSDQDAATRRLREELRTQQGALEFIDSPLDPTSYLGQLQVDRCKVLGSAKLPLRLTWTNTSPLAELYAPVYEIIFKNGDDLRQDMLVLQMLEVMDSIWKKHKLDCCLCVYPVLPMGNKIGMIGVVQDCSTIFEIQSKGGRYVGSVNALDSTTVNNYLRSNFPVAKDYLECVDRFLMSCVAYSVATYVMGIKDRHNDNIMMTRDGRLFHIDFGHILGHGKTKLGIQRDRTPFVLTEHLVCVIVKGAKGGKELHDMNKFKQLTIDAYAFLWEYRTLFLSLFSMMRSMNLPELSTDADLDYLKYALSSSTTDRKQAEVFFSQVFDEALKSSWSTKTNWFFHTVKHL